MAEVILPTLLAKELGGIRQLDVPGSSVAELVNAINAKHPGFRDLVCSGEKLRPIFRVVIDGRIAREGLASPVQPTSRVEILPAFGGG
ncbi:MAG: MoaD/ThiS family protein [Thermoguttaceae bacterium]|nr:MoaD/ThiS family protein [Thermoguttaceae bacterium]MDW8078623.1 MoaD/ThiS family protein [Thermoguttaceae bacterium]